MFNGISHDDDEQRWALARMNNAIAKKNQQQQQSMWKSRKRQKSELKHSAE